MNFNTILLTMLVCTGLTIKSESTATNLNYVKCFYEEYENICAQTDEQNKKIELENLITKIDSKILHLKAGLIGSAIICSGITIGGMLLFLRSMNIQYTPSNNTYNPINAVIVGTPMIMLNGLTCKMSPSIQDLEQFKSEVQEKITQITTIAA